VNNINIKYNMTNTIKKGTMFYPENWATGNDRESTCLDCGEHAFYIYNREKCKNDLPIVIELFVGEDYIRKLGWLCLECGNKFSTVGNLREKESLITKVPEEVLLKII
jgi:hypothetical protein